MANIVVIFELILIVQPSLEQDRFHLTHFMENSVDVILVLEGHKAVAVRERTTRR